VREFEETNEKERQMGHSKKRPRSMTIYSSQLGAFYLSSLIKHFLKEKNS